MRVAWWAWTLLGVVLLAGVLSPFASRLPDGLESVIERRHIPMAEHRAPAPLPGYATPGVANQRVSVFVASAVGIVVVFVVTLLLGRILSRRPRRPPRSTPGDHEPPL